MELIKSLLVALLLAGCAALPGRQPAQVTVADIESLPSEDLEMRMLVKLRVQNPNDSPIEYDGVFVQLDVLDETFATGVSDERGTIPRFGESIVSVPVTASALRLAVNVLGMIGGGQKFDKVNYRMHGKLNGPMWGSVPFEAQGELTLPVRATP